MNMRMCRCRSDSREIYADWCMYGATLVRAKLIAVNKMGSPTTKQKQRGESSMDARTVSSKTESITNVRAIVIVRK